MGDGKLMVFDIRTEKLLTNLPGFPSMTGVLVVPSLKRVYGSVTKNHEVAVVDTESLAVLKRISDGKFPDGLAFSPETKKLYVSDESGGVDTVIDTSTNMKLTAIALGAITLLLAMAGLYGIQSHIIANRTREIGVRMSFGATSAQIKRMVLMDGYRPVLDGLVFGLLIGLIGRASAREPTPEHSFTGKVALYTEYEYRGISQTSEKPAGQLNLDYAHASGIYVGTFLSNIKWLKDTAEVNGFTTSANLETTFDHLPSRERAAIAVGGQLVDFGEASDEFARLFEMPLDASYGSRLSELGPRPSCLESSSRSR